MKSCLQTTATRLLQPHLTVLAKHQGVRQPRPCFPPPLPSPPKPHPSTQGEKPAPDSPPCSEGQGGLRRAVLGWLPRGLRKSVCSSAVSKERRGKQSGEAESKALGLGAPLLLLLRAAEGGRQPAGPV